ncbi:MAG: hypothetical protein LBB45_08115 [Methanobrevibacter sp.]|jgi:hypothetical protein|nr:hypothetical protein [Candidatus Methanovirga basalitermitum]
MNKTLKFNLRLDVVDEKKDYKFFIDTNRLLSMVEPGCSRCGSPDVIKFFFILFFNPLYLVLNCDIVFECYLILF